MKTRQISLYGLVIVSLLWAGLGEVRAQSDTTSWSLAQLDQILAGVQPGQTLAKVGDMQILVSNLQFWRNQLAGGPPPPSAFGGSAPTWTGGNVYYSFSNNVTALHQQAFVNAAGDWATFANLHFIPRTAQANYLLVGEEVGTTEGGSSVVGMVGGPQSFLINSSQWSRSVLCHELGHALGLVHEHQRSDRDTNVTIITGNIMAGFTGDFIKLGDSLNHGPYDFLSVMHYSRNAFSTSPGLDTIEPTAPYAQFINIMGNSIDLVLSPGDRAGMAAVYGAGPAISSVVSNTLDTGPGSLRTALYYAYDHPGTMVTFNIPTNDPGFASGVFTIQPLDQLPSLVNATVVDGTTEPAQLNTNGPAIQLNGALAQPLAIPPCGVRFGGSNCVARGLIINGFQDSSAFFDSTNCTGNVISGCYLGIDSSGQFAVTNGFYPVHIANGAHSNTVGGVTSAARNIISGSAIQGVLIENSGTIKNVVEGNYIGLNAQGTAALPNGFSGVLVVNSATSNVIGGSVAGARNVVSGNTQQGVVISGAGATGNVVAGNFIGLSAAGTNAIPNANAGMQIDQGATGNIVGPGNVISGNAQQGVLIFVAGTMNNWVQGNYIGLNSTGTAAVPNSFSGVQLDLGAQGNTIGGTLPSMRNVISGNNNQGVLIASAGTSGNVVEGNYIGLNAAGTAAVANAAPGVQILNSASGNLIGGGPGSRNVISGNNPDGVDISGAGTTGNLVQGNTIGLNAANTAGVPNNGFGVVIYSGAASNQVGGVALGTANLIADNLDPGVYVTDSGTIDNAVRGNSVFGNSIGGILIASGGNNSQAAPSLGSAVVSTNTTINGSLTSLANTTYHLDFFASLAPGVEATTYLGSKDVTTGAGGSVGFGVALPVTVPAGQTITATATDPSGNTSALSGIATVTSTDSVGDGIPNAWRAAHFGGGGTTTNSQSCAACDPDHDGMSNLQEFLAGTDPNNAASVLRAGAVTINGTNAILTFQTEQGFIYRVQSRDDLVLGAWFILADQVIGPGGVLQITDPGAGSLPKRFYRVEVMQ